VLEKLRGFFHW